MSQQKTPQQTLPEVADFVTRVRTALDDLPEAERDELTNGLEADVQEAHDHATGLSGEPPAWFGDPLAYAAELRSAADLPVRGAGTDEGDSRPSRRSAFFDYRVSASTTRQQYAQTRTRLEGQPWWPAAAAFGSAIEPAWWVLRGWAVCAVLAMFSGRPLGLVPGRDLAWAVLLGAVVLCSVQIGRGEWPVRGDWPRRALWAVNATTVLALLVAAASGPQIVYLDSASSSDTDAGSDAGSGSVEDEPGPVVIVHGERASNLFVYGPDGQLVDGARIVDEQGRPVVLDDDDVILEEYSDDAQNLAPRTDIYGQPVLNAYPVLISRNHWTGYDELNEVDLFETSTISPTAPAPSIAPLAAQPTSPTASPTSPTASPTSLKASPTPSAEPTTKPVTTTQR